MHQRGWRPPATCDFCTNRATTRCLARWYQQRQTHAFIEGRWQFDDDKLKMLHRFRCWHVCYQRQASYGGLATCCNPGFFIKASIWGAISASQIAKHQILVESAVEAIELIRLTGSDGEEYGVGNICSKCCFCCSSSSRGKHLMSMYGMIVLAF